MVMTETLRRSDSLLALLVLVALSAGLVTVEAQASNECDKHLMACLNEHLVRFDHRNPTADMADTCRILKDFSDCVFKIECLTHSSKDELVNNLTSSFQNFGVDCDQQPTASTPRDPTHSSVPQVSSVDSACAEARNNCTTEFIEESFINEAKSQGADMRSWFCPSLNMYLDCLMSVSCDEENYDQSVRLQIEQAMQQAGITCVIHRLDDLDKTVEGEKGGETVMVEDKKDVTEGPSTDSMGGKEDGTYKTIIENTGDGTDGKDVTLGGGEEGEEEEEGTSVEEGGEQAGATLTGSDRDSAPSPLSGMWSGAVISSLLTSLSILLFH